MNFTLTKAVTFDGKDYSILALREPKAGEMEKAQIQSAKYGFVMSLISQVAGIPMGAVDLMGQRDTEEIEEFIGEYIPAPDDEIEESPAEFSMVLKNPVTLGDLNYAELELREPINAERRQASKAGDSFAVAIAQISLVAKVPKAMVRAMSATDFLEAMKYFQGFSTRRLRTGKN